MTANDGASASGIPIAEFEARQERARQIADDRGLAGLLVWSRGGASWEQHGDVCYLANFHSPLGALPDTRSWTAHGHAAVVLPVEGEPILLADTIDDPDGRLVIADARAVAHLPQAVAAALKEKGMVGTPVGLAGTHSFLHKWHNVIRGTLESAVSLEPADDILGELRYVKSANEIELMRRAAAVGTGWMNTTLGAVEPGRTEAQLVGEGLKYLAEHGGQAYDVGIAAGPMTKFFWGSLEIPHWRMDRPLETGDLLHCDQWGPVQGYFTDIARSTVVGRSPDPSQRKLLEGAKDLIEHIVSGIKPGVTWDSLYKRAEDWLADSEFAAAEASAKEAGHSAAEVFPAFGHSLGLTEETPYIMQGETIELVPNVVLAVEGVVGLPEVGMAGFEHDVLVTESGYEILDEACPSVWWD